MRWRRGLTVLTRRHGTIQIGTDPRWAVRLSGLAEAESRMLRAVSDVEDVPVERLARRHGVPGERARALQAQLERARVLAPPPRHRSGSVREPVPARLADELRVQGLLAEDADGTRLVAARAHRLVEVEGLGRTGAALAAALAASGVGTLVLGDPSPVRPWDVGAAGLREEDLGAPREQAVARAVTGLAAGARAVAGAPPRTPDLVVRVFSWAVDPERAWAEVPLLPVVLGEAGAVVGPLALPGTGPCLRCVELHRAEDDRDWPLVHAQLCALARSSPAPEPAALAHLVAGVAASQVLAHLDGHEPVTAAAALEVSLPQGTTERRERPPHEACDHSRR